MFLYGFTSVCAKGKTFKTLSELRKLRTLQTFNFLKCLNGLRKKSVLNVFSRNYFIN